MAELYTIKLGNFDQCPSCHHMSYYPFSDGWMCVLCEHTGNAPATEEPSETSGLSKNARRKANKAKRRAAEAAEQS